MGAMVVLWAVLLATTTAADASSRRGVARGPSNPCQFHECPRGEQCVVHDVVCEAGPCPRIGECRPIDCPLPCPAGAECRMEVVPCVREPCPLQPRCRRAPDACRGRCLPDELCMSHVQPCRTPPCREQHVCVPSHQLVTARRQPAARAVRDACPADANPCRPASACMMTTVCRQKRECITIPVCVDDCSVTWCGQGHVCRMLEALCEHGPCPLKPTCVSSEPTAAPQPEPVLGLGLQLGQRFGSAGNRDVCPLDDLRKLSSPAFCSDRLDQCQQHSDCGDKRHCCQRGCGNTCLPTCRRGCAAGEECRLVEVRCIGSPCPKVAQCLAAEPEESEDTVLPPLRPNEANRERFPPRPPPKNQQQLPEDKVSRPPFGDAGRPTTSVSVAGAGDAAANARPGGASRPGSFGGGGGGVGGGARPPARAGSCPVNDPQVQSAICFDNGSVDQCREDSDCPSSTRCCLHGCQRQCRPVCPKGCRPDRECKLLPGRPDTPVCWPIPH
ncbi:keratin-associated protein 10-7-like [Pollicipes pollicipes]|uniref:keratin-associated protein 10-7-like n=1 Tax=Pollicipes pollicipes TaxID=41117 RepID=UPI001884FFAB|nr:keratin-associated protein 10-7-like [Pollicipes pollicipes]